MTESWRNFLDSLATRGGGILVLMLATLVLGVVILHGQYSSQTGESASLIRNTFAAFSGALLTALTTMGKANNKGTQISTETKLEPGDPIALHTILPTLAVPQGDLK